MRLIYAGIVFACASLAFADTITLKNGDVIRGTYLGGTARTLRVDDGNNVQNVDVSDVVRIEFGSSATAQERERPRDDDRPAITRRDSNVMRPGDPPPPPPAPSAASTGMTGVTLPQGTNLTIRMID